MTRILIVDDDRQMRRTLQIMMERLGYTSTAVGNGDDALQVLRSEHYDLVLTDLRMPRMSGLELLEEMRQVDLTLPVIVILSLIHI